MNADLTRSIVRILGTASQTCGTGFVVNAGDDSLIITCAHIIEYAKSGPGQSIALTFFPFDLDRSAKKYSAIVEPAYWRDADAEDIAMLHLEGPFPGGVEPLRLGSSLGSEDHVFQSYGFSKAKPLDGMWGQCTVRGRTSENGFPVWQMDSSEVSHGFSGAPVWDEKLQVVIGMVTSIAMPDSAGRQTRVNFVIPAETLSRVCSGLRLTDKPPYQGLSSFTEEDAAVFFGREQAIKEVLKKLGTHRQFLAVFGPSGSGKSSLVRAGVIPRLQEEHGLHGKDWGVIVTRPADNPFKQLSDQGLDSEPDGLIGGVRRWLTQHPDKQRLLLIIDQFEELFVTCPEAQRSLFLKQLTQLRNEPCVTVIIVMRNDFYSQFVEHEALREWLAMSGGATNIPQTLKRNDVLDIILKPAERYRLRFQEALPDLIIRDVMQESSHPSDEDEETAQCTVLPLLEFVLTQLWEQRQQGVLTGDAYRAIGGVAGALTQWANRVLAKIGEERRPLVERIFLALVHPGEEASRQPDSRQPASFASLTELSRNDSERASLQDVIQELVNARLLVIHGERQRHEGTVEIIHDALLNHWPALQYWIARDRSFLQWHQELERRAQAWIETNREDVSQRDEGGLLRGRDLTAAEDMFNTRGDALTARQREYIQASQKQMTDELEKERQRTAELRTALETAQRQKQMALARALAAEAFLYSQDLDSHDIDVIERSILLAIESQRRFPSLQADQSLRKGAALLRRGFGILKHKGDVYPIVFIEFSPDGRLLATACAEMVGLWEVNSGKELATLEHGTRVDTVAFSPDGRLLATMGGGMIELWEVDSGKQVARLEGYRWAMAFSLDGRLLAAASKDRTVKIWEVDHGKELATLEHKYDVPGILFSPDGRRLATASKDRTVKIWEVDSGKQVATLRHDSDVDAGAFSRDGRLLATACAEMVELWEVDSGKQIATLEHGARVDMVMFSRDGRLLATACPENVGLMVAASTGRMTKIWEVDSSKQIAMLRHKVYMDGGAYTEFSPDGRLLATAGRGIARLWEVDSGKQVAMLRHKGDMYAVAFSPDGRLLATAGEGIAKTWEVDSHEQIAILRHEHDVNMVAFSSDGRLLATACAGMIELWEVDSGKQVARLEDEHEVKSVAFSPDGRLLGAMSSGIAGLWDNSKQVAEETLSYGMVLSPDGRLLTTADETQWVKLWELDSGKQVAELDEHNTRVYTVAFSPDGRLLATGCIGGVGLWKVDSHEQIARLEHESNIDVLGKVAFSPDGRLLAAATGKKPMQWSGKKAMIWEVDSGRQIATLEYEHEVKSVAFSPDGQWLATGSKERTAGVWEVSSSQQIVLLNHEDEVNDVAFSPNGKYLATASGNIAAIWLWQPEDLITAVQPKLTRNLTPEEWKRFLGDEPYRKTFEDLPMEDG